jgi:hypothetical protein
LVKTLPQCGEKEGDMRKYYRELIAGVRGDVSRLETRIDTMRGNPLLRDGMIGLERDVRSLWVKAHEAQHDLDRLEDTINLILEHLGKEVVDVDAHRKLRDK